SGRGCDLNGSQMMPPIIAADFENRRRHRIKAHKLHYGVISPKGKFYFKFSIIIRDISVHQAFLLAVIDGYGRKSNRGRGSAIQHGSLYRPCLRGLAHGMMPTREKEQKSPEDGRGKRGMRKIVHKNKYLTKIRFSRVNQGSLLQNLQRYGISVFEREILQECRYLLMKSLLAQATLPSAAGYRCFRASGRL